MSELIPSTKLLVAQCYDGMTRSAMTASCYEGKYLLLRMKRCKDVAKVTEARNAWLVAKADAVSARAIWTSFYNNGVAKFTI